MTATVATTYAAASGFAYVDLISPATDASFTTQPVVNDQIYYPTSIYVDSNLDISGSDGTYDLIHIKAADGFAVYESYTISGNSFRLSVATTYAATSAQTQVELITGFDTYLFDGWSVSTPAIGWQFVTTTTDGYFDNLGNFYTDLEQVTDFWAIDLTGTAYYLTIDSTGLGDVSNLSPIDLGADIAGVDPSSTTDRSFLITGIGAGSVTVSSIGDSLVNVNGGAFSGSVSASNNDLIVLRSTASANYSESNITGVAVDSVTQDTINITTRAIITPTINTQPSSATITEGSTVLFSSVWDSDSYTFQWYLVGTGAMAGETAQDLEINAILADDGNQYYITATSSDSEVVQSNTVTLTVLSESEKIPPQILGQRTFQLQTDTAFSANYVVNNSGGNDATLSGDDASLFVLTQTATDNYTLTMAAKDFFNPTDADADNTYNVNINVDDVVNPVSSALITVEVLEVAPPLVVGYPYNRTADWLSPLTPKLVIGDSFYNLVTLKQGVNSVVQNVSTAESIKARIVSLDHSEYYSETATLLASDSGSNWSNGLVIVNFPSSHLSGMSAFFSSQGYAKVEIEVVLGGASFTWFAPVRVIPGYID